MNNIQAIADKVAISLSFICTIHCLLLPVLAIFLPIMAILNLNDEAFHQWMVVAVIPISLIALTIGCKKHKNFNIMLLGLSGISLLFASALYGHTVMGEIGEKMLTVFGSCLVAFGHLLNYRQCLRVRCQCHP